MDIAELFVRSEEASTMTPERRILVATLDCIAELGLQGATVRLIASKAGLNAAAVNYYYRSKDRLMEAALRYAWTHVSEDIDRIVASTKDGREGLETAVRFLIEGAHQYPAIIRAILVEEPGLRREAGAFFKDLFERLGVKAGSGVEPGLGTALLLALSTFIGLAPEAFAALSGRNPDDAGERDRLAADITPWLFRIPPV